MTTEQKHYARSSFSKGAAKLGISILQTAKQPERVFQHGRYFAIPGQTQLEKDVFERILAIPKVQESWPIDLPNDGQILKTWPPCPKAALDGAFIDDWRNLGFLF